MSSQDGKVESEGQVVREENGDAPSQQEDTFANALRSWSSDAGVAGAADDPTPSRPAPMPGLKEPLAPVGGGAHDGAAAADPSASWGAPTPQGGYADGQGAGYPPYPGAAPPHAQAGWQPPYSQGPAGYPGHGYNHPAGQNPAAWPGSYPGQQPAPGQQPWSGYPPGQPPHGQYQPQHAPANAAGQGGYAPGPQGGWQPHPGYDQQQWNQQWGQQAHYPPMQVPQQSTIPVHQLASRGRRLAGAFLDGFLSLFICLPFAMAAAFLVGGGPITDDELFGIMVLALIPGMLLSFVINAVLITRHGKTLAKFALGMRIVRTDGGPVDFMRGVVMRWLVPSLAAGFLPGFQFIDALVIFSGEKRQTLHDMLAGTQVIDD